MQIEGKVKYRELSNTITCETDLRFVSESETIEEDKEFILIHAKDLFSKAYKQKEGFNMYKEMRKPK